MRTTNNKFKDLNIAVSFLSLRPIMFLILYEILDWCDTHNLPCVITSALRDYEKGQVSATHPEGRAIDISVIGWSEKNINEFVSCFNSSDTCKKYGAVNSSGIPTLVVYHCVVGSAFHLHIQTKRGI